MAQITVRRGVLQGGQVTRLDIEIHGLPGRTIDRDTALRYLADGHSLLPGGGGPALLRVEVDGVPYLRHDTAAVPSDALGDDLLAP